MCISVCLIYYTLYIRFYCLQFSFYQIRNNFILITIENCRLNIVQLRASILLIYQHIRQNDQLNNTYHSMNIFAYKVYPSIILLIFYKTPATEVAFFFNFFNLKYLNPAVSDLHGHDIGFVQFQLFYTLTTFSMISCY